jgi:hypothetical protein
MRYVCIMKFLAVILSCLILLLSTAAGGTIVMPKEKKCAKAEISQAQCCGCCCENNGRQMASDANNADDSKDTPHKGCPFCISNTCPGFIMTTTTIIPAIFAENHSEYSLFVRHKYISPSPGGIWQPPKTA